MLPRLFLLLVIAVGCGCGDGTPKQTTDEQALEHERTKGREVRENLEGIPPRK